MGSSNGEVGNLPEEISACETQLSKLRSQLAEVESKDFSQSADTSTGFDTLTYGRLDVIQNEVLVALDLSALPHQGSLDHDDFERYQWQILVPEVGYYEQVAVKKHFLLMVLAVLWLPIFPAPVLAPSAY
ncbi:hypothetical protein BU26DRAFT_565255 [Trematosphaeria pertusa]|uniref:Uncharacterized protein n=1 Tax=Trematosphaeria pertusa TaxID=390896 RepID=A0A6A6ID48_9PLEO|nr:uncharacterized protein BU26DRAFT_565255 [Trematosphaeria pertusa]KAF2247822.1 hypothetical protein BU26DRAFT_565255 [Trematosphaeria pertusa]